MLISVLLLALAALLASGSLFKHTKILTYIAAAAILWEMGWLLLTLVTRTVFPNEGNAVFLAGSGLFLASALYLTRLHRPRLPLGRGRHDLASELAVITIVVIVLLGSFIVVRANGFIDHKYVTFGFYNGDVATLSSIVNRSLHTKTFVSQNPFSANGPLEYPTLLHAGIAHLVGGKASGWMLLLPAMTYIAIFATIPLFFLVWETFPLRRSYPSWLPLFLIGLVLAGSWDSYIYPQSNFFLAGLLLLLVAVLQSAAGKEQVLKLASELVAAGIALVLLLANTIFGSVAVATLGVYFICQAVNQHVPSLQRNWYWVGLAGLASCFLLFSPGEPAFGVIGFSYSTVPEMLRLAPLLILLITGMFLAVRTQVSFVLLPTVLFAAAFFTFIFSARDIVVANSGRFFYLALLTSFPLMAAPAAYVLAFIREQLLHTRGLLPKFTLWVLVAISFGLFIMPSAGSMASAYGNLLFNDAQVADTAMRTALWWVEDNTPADAVFLASPFTPFSIPALTGRALLRSDDFWLSPQDVVLEDIRAAFTGDTAAREQLYSLADYVLLEREERALFEPLPEQYTKVFDNNAIVIYELAQSARNNDR